MTFVKPITEKPRTIVDFKKMDFKVLEKDIHPIDQIELLKQGKPSQLSNFKIP